MSKSPQIILIHPGTQYSYQLAKQLHRKGYLFLFITGIAVAGKSILGKLIEFLPSSVKNKVKQRVVGELNGSKLKIFPRAEMEALRRVKKKHTSNDIFFDRNLKFQEQVKEGLIKKSDIVIGFDTSSWLVAERAVQMGVPFLLDVSIAHSLSKQSVYYFLESKYPEWKFNIELKKQSFIELEQMEYERSTAIIAASTFTKKTLIENGVDESKIFVNPYGVDSSQFRINRKNKSNKIRFLFVGLVDARKGIPHLIKIWKLLLLENIELTIVGPVSPDVERLILKEGLTNVYITGKVPHADLPAIFNNNDVFIFPSFFEGFGLVILEAMAAGLPVITTTATVGPDIIEDGKEGFIIAPGDDQALINAIKHFHQFPDSIISMGNNARKKAEEYTWDAYGERWISIIDSVLKLQKQE